MMNDNRHTETAALWIAIILTLVWAIGIAVIYVLYPEAAIEISRDQSLTALMLVGLFLPLALVWMAALLARAVSAMRAEAKDLRKSVEKMRKTLEIQVVEDSETRDRWIQGQLAQISALTKQTDSHVSAIAQQALQNSDQPSALRNTAALLKKTATVMDDAQADLPLPENIKPHDTPITIRELIKALNFPDNANDVEGFNVLRRVFKDHRTAKLLQSAQDILTMLSEDGIYMDDLRVEHPAASAWRSFANGLRGKDVAALGLVRDRTALTLCKTRLRNDPVFRETAHGFLTHFDTMIIDFENTAQDVELDALSKTRSAYAFMLLGRVSGAFENH